LTNLTKSVYLCSGIVHIPIISILFNCRFSLQPALFCIIQQIENLQKKLGVGDI